MKEGVVRAPGKPAKSLGSHWPLSALPFPGCLLLFISILVTSPGSYPYPPGHTHHPADALSTLKPA